MVPGIPENHDAFIVKGQGVQFAMYQGACVLVWCIVVNTALILTAFKEGTTYRHVSYFINILFIACQSLSEPAGSV